MPTLYIVATHIGNTEDLAPRAARVITEADFIIGEEFKPTSKLLKYIGAQKEIALLNEHSKPADIDFLVEEILKAGSVCLVCDAGTPLIEDPGARLVKRLGQQAVDIQAVPGPAAFVTALVLSGFPAVPVTFAGFLSPKPQKRKAQLEHYKKSKGTTILYETPYRYKQLLADMQSVLGGNREVFICLDLTMDSQRQLRGSLDEICQKVSDWPKGEPVIVF